MDPNRHLKDSQLEAALFRRRATVAAVFVFLAFGLLVVRYGWLQIVQHERYRTLSDSNRIKLQAIAPPRGYIYDRNGLLLADNRPSFTATLNREEAGDINGTLLRLAPVLQLTPEDLARFRSRLNTAGPYENTPVKTNLSEADIARFTEVSFDFPGVSIEVKLTRYYPYGELFAHAIGYVGRISEAEAKQIDPAVYSGTDLIGKTGIEKYYEKLLQGRPGYQYIEANAHGQMLRPLDRTAPTRGDDLVLHLDYTLQKLAHEQLAGRRGAIIAIDPAPVASWRLSAPPASIPTPLSAAFPTSSTVNGATIPTGRSITAPCKVSTRPAPPSSRSSAWEACTTIWWIGTTRSVIPVFSTCPATATGSATGRSKGTAW